MERVVHGNDFVVSLAVLEKSVFSGSLERTFHSLRAGVGEKHPVHAGHCFQLLRRVDGRHIVIVVGSVQQLVYLGFQGVIVFLIVVAKGKYAYAGDKIQVFDAVRVV